MIQQAGPDWVWGPGVWRYYDFRPVIYRGRHRT